MPKLLPTPDEPDFGCSANSHKQLQARNSVDQLAAVARTQLDHLDQNLAGSVSSPPTSPVSVTSAGPSSPSNKSLPSMPSMEDCSLASPSFEPVLATPAETVAPELPPVRNLPPPATTMHRKRSPMVMSDRGTPYAAHLPLPSAPPESRNDTHAQYSNTYSYPAASPTLPTLMPLESDRSYLYYPPPNPGFQPAYPQPISPPPPTTALYSSFIPPNAYPYGSFALPNPPTPRRTMLLNQRPSCYVPHGPPYHNSQPRPYYFPPRRASPYDFPVAPGGSYVSYEDVSIMKGGRSPSERPVGPPTLTRPAHNRYRSHHS